MATVPNCNSNSDTTRLIAINIAKAATVVNDRGAWYGDGSPTTLVNGIIEGSSGDYWHNSNNPNSTLRFQYSPAVLVSSIVLYPIAAGELLGYQFFVNGTEVVPPITTTAGPYLYHPATPFSMTEVYFTNSANKYMGISEVQIFGSAQVQSYSCDSNADISRTVSQNHSCNSNADILRNVIVVNVNTNGNIASQAAIATTPDVDDESTLLNGKSLQDLVDGDKITQVIGAGDSGWLGIAFTYNTPQNIATVIAYTSTPPSGLDSSYSLNSNWYFYTDSGGEQPTTVTIVAFGAGSQITFTLSGITSALWAFECEILNPIITIAEIEMYLAAAPIIYNCNNNVDVLRKISGHVACNNNVDVKRIITLMVFCNSTADLKRIITLMVHCNSKVDIKRIVTTFCNNKADASRKIGGASNNTSDTCRKIYGQLSFADTPKIDFSLGTKDLTPRYNIDSYVDYPKDTNYSQTLYNHTMLLTIKEHIYKPMEGLYNLVGVDMKEELINNTITLTVPEGGFAAQYICQKLAQALNKTLVWRCNDFVPAAIAGQTNSLTFKEIVNRAFDWSIGIPNMAITVTIRGSNLYVVQRGSEPLAYTPVNYAVRSISQRDIWTLKSKTNVWSDVVWNTAVQKIYGQPNPGGVNQELYTGTIASGGAMLAYSSGYLSQQSEQGAVTNYSYKYMVGWTYNLVAGKTVTHAKGSVVSSYAYDGNDDLIEMDELTYDANGTLTNTSITTYAPIDFDALGHWAVNNYQNGVFMASSIVKGAQSSRVSPQLAYDNSQQKSKPTASVNGIPFGSSTFPICDFATIQRIANNLNFLNGKTEKRLQVDVYDQFIVDPVDYTVLVDGESYYIEDNHIIREAEKWAQSLSLVRWY